MIATALLFAATLTAAEPPPQQPAAQAAEASEPTEGRTVLECRVIRGGHLRDCVVLEETPPGSGFGEAALRASKRFKMKSRTADGRSTAGGRVRIPMTWKLSDAPASDAPTPEPAAAPVMKPVVPARYYPTQARKQGVAGSATIDCRVTLEGRLADCGIVAETPSGFGFGQAAVAWAQKEARLKAKPGATGSERVQLPLRFSPTALKPMRTEVIRPDDNPTGQFPVGSQPSN